MARLSGNDELSSRNFGNSQKQTNWILDSGAMRNRTPQVQDFIPGLFEYTDKYIEVADGNHVTEKQKE